MTRRLLMVAHQYPPDAGPSAFRMRYRAEFLAQRGWRVEVFAPGDEEENPTDGQNPGIHRIPPVLGGTATLDYTRGRERSRLLTLAPLSGYIRWLPALVRRLKPRAGEDAVLYTYNNPVVPHLAGVLLRWRLGGWVAEFRDPIRGYEYSGRGLLGRLLDGWLEHGVLSRADVVCMRRGIQARPEDFAGAKAHVEALPDYGVELGQFREFRPARYEGGALRGVFAGTVFDDIDLGPLDQALGRLPSPCEAQVELYGPAHPRHAGLRRAQYGGMLTFDELLERYRAAHFFIVYDESTRESTRQAGFIPSKLAELLAARRPILFIGRGDSLAAQRITELRSGVYVENDPDAIARGIGAVAEGLQSGAFDLASGRGPGSPIDIDVSENAFASLLEERF